MPDAFAARTTEGDEGDCAPPSGGVDTATPAMTVNDSARKGTDDGRPDDDRHSVPHGEAPGDHAREQAKFLVMRERGPTRVAVYDDAKTDEWVEADAQTAVEVQR